MWSQKRLKFAAAPSRLKIDERPSNSPYVGLENVDSWTGRLIPEAEKVAEDTEENGAAANVFDAGDVLFGKLRPYLAKAFRADFSGYCSTEFLVMRPAPELDGDFLLYWLLRPQFIDLVNSSTFGARMPRADWEFVGNIEIALPSVGEQQRIAAYLDRETARLDELREEKERFLELLELKRTALIAHAVTRGLDKNAPLKPSGIEWLGDVPEHWEVVRLKFKLQNQMTPERAAILDEVNEVSFLPMECIGEQGELDLSRVKLREEIGSGYTLILGSLHETEKIVR